MAKIIKGKARVDQRLARALADYDNLVKRFGREREEITLRATRKLVEELLPVVDDLMRAQGHLKDNGLAMAMEHFRKVLEAHGVEEIPTRAGDKFDSRMHEAIETIDGEKHGIIESVLSPGYRWQDGQVLRPVRVRVFGKEPEKVEELDKEMIRGEYP